MDETEFEGGSYDETECRGAGRAPRRRRQTRDDNNFFATPMSCSPPASAASERA